MVLQGVSTNTFQLTELSADSLVKWISSNDVWAVPVVELLPDKEESPLPLEVQEVLTEFKDVFEEPTGLPPERVHDHTISTIPGAIPVNSKPYNNILFIRMKLKGRLRIYLLRASLNIVLALMPHMFS